MCCKVWVFTYVNCESKSFASVSTYKAACVTIFPLHIHLRNLGVAGSRNPGRTAREPAETKTKKSSISLDNDYV